MNEEGIEPNPNTSSAIVDHALTFLHGGMTREELSILRLACNGARVCEVGSMVGMSSYVIASVARELVCVDLWPDNFDFIEPRQREIYEKISKILPNMYEQFKRNMEGKTYTEKRGLAHVMARELPDNYFNIILMDADHSYEGLARDYAAFSPKLASGGMWLFHDYGSAMWPDVTRFVDDQGLKIRGLVGYLAGFRKQH